MERSSAEHNGHRARRRTDPTCAYCAWLHRLRPLLRRQRRHEAQDRVRECIPTLAVRAAELARDRTRLRAAIAAAHDLTPTQRAAVRQELERALEDAISADEAASTRGIGPLSFEQALTTYVRWRDARFPASSHGGTTAGYAGFVRVLLRFLAKQYYLRTIGQVRPKHLEAYIAALGARGTSPSSRRQRLVAIRNFFAVLTELGYFTVSPAASLTGRRPQRASGTT